MKKFLVLLLVVTMAASFVYAVGQKEEMSSEPMISGAYVPGQTETAYAYTHGGYVGMAKVMTDDNGDLSVMLDETFLPHTLAIVDIEAPEWTENNTTQYLSRGSVGYVAKYVEYNGTVYVGVETGATFSYVEADEAGMPTGGTDLEKAILRNQGTMATYTALAKAGQFKVFTEFGGTPVAITTTSYGAVNKKDAPGYWGGDRATTWMSNMKAIEDFIAENGLQFNEADMVRAAEENAEGLKVWSVADAVSGATNSDFKDYFGMAQHAAGKLKTN